ncbi:pyridoxamine 5'-phosphate oxidase family protein [Lunatibacter salilacus]|uniref:pyridoxamine 5'-phosphate oxidase family protein n=1 Tax=Lunatibacter salilacus TaxID=2483804 RepID=UPI00131CF54E|nr:pyridoxamine 5'-phosphate oxidase family protein [Lunatibacter salilacus]
MLITKNNELSEVLKIVLDALKSAAKDTGHPFRFMSLATIHQQVPDIRYVVLRAMDAEGCLYFFTDYRTQKIGHIRANPDVALLFYDSEKGVQIRMQGTALVHRNNAVAEKFWMTVEGEAQKAYNPVLTPGTLISHPVEAYNWPENMGNSNFSVVQIVPSEFNVLQLDGMNHIRAKYVRNDDKWKMDWIAP